MSDHTTLPPLPCLSRSVTESYPDANHNSFASLDTDSENPQAAVHTLHHGLRFPPITSTASSWADDTSAPNWTKLTSLRDDKSWKTVESRRTRRKRRVDAKILLEKVQADEEEALAAPSSAPPPPELEPLDLVRDDCMGDHDPRSPAVVHHHAFACDDEEYVVSG